MDPFRRFTSGAVWAAVQGWQSQRVNWSTLRTPCKQFAGYIGPPLGLNLSEGLGLSALTWQ